ncbi:MAG: hypothetical protein ABIN57_03640 [Chitinophagaceae bacterium]
MILNENNSMPYMKSLATCLHKMISDGYTEDFTVTEKGLKSLQQERNYAPEQVKVINFFKFEGPSNPDDNAILYVIEVEDGTKGTLIDAFGVYSDEQIGVFLKNVGNVYKKVLKN